MLTRERWRAVSSGSDKQRGQRSDARKSTESQQTVERELRADADEESNVECGEYERRERTVDTKQGSEGRRRWSSNVVTLHRLPMMHY